MSNYEKFRQGIVLEHTDEGYVLELWGASTKHPDEVFKMKDFQLPFWVDPNDPAQIDGQVFQWLLECASKMLLPFHARNLVDYAIKNWWDPVYEK